VISSKISQMGLAAPLAFLKRGAGRPVRPPFGAATAVLWFAFTTESLGKHASNGAHPSLFQ